VKFEYLFLPTVFVNNENEIMYLMQYNSDKLYAPD